jgi:predicted TPR repeat methyltransferase
LRRLRGCTLAPQTRILDVGCGGGLLLHGLRELGLKQLLGVDPYNPADLKYDNGLVVAKKGIHDVSGQWDIVMFHDSFEHMPNPFETLTKVSQLLSPSGQCLLAIPVASSHAWRHYGVHWVQLDAPRHLFLHSETSIGILSARAGLTVRRVVYDSTSFQFWGSQQYQQGMILRDPRSHYMNPKKSAFTRGQIAAFDQEAQVLNAQGQGDHAVFWLGKTLAA